MEDGLYFPSVEEYEQGLFSNYDFKNGVAAWEEGGRLHHFSYPEYTHWNGPTMLRPDVLINDETKHSYWVADVGNGQRVMFDEKTGLYDSSSYIPDVPYGTDELTSYNWKLVFDVEVPSRVIEATQICGSGGGAVKPFFDTATGRLFVASEQLDTNSDLKLFDLSSGKEIETANIDGVNTLIWSDTGIPMDVADTVVNGDVVNLVVNQSADAVMAAASPFPVLAVGGALGIVALRYGLVKAPAKLQWRALERAYGLQNNRKAPVADLILNAKAKVSNATDNVVKIFKDKIHNR